MYKRNLNILKSNSFFLFGARGTGKSTLVENLLRDKDVFAIDLLDPANFELASFRVDEFMAQVEAAVADKKWIFIDEVQRVPKLLDIAQKFIDKKGAKFALTGSSARKLKRGSANLLAGRAYSYNLYPLTSDELASDFDLDKYLSYGGIPHVWNVSTSAERVKYLRSYVTTYLREEISEEQVVRNLEPFGRFLQIAAQSSGKVINYSNISRDVGVSDQTVKTYFQILEDTLLGYFVPAFHESVRKSQGKSPKFYLFDLGVIRALKRSIDLPLVESTYEYGDLFEHFVIGEIKRRAEYQERDYHYSFLRTSNDKEIDLIVDRPGKPRLLLEIKSTKSVRNEDVKDLALLSNDFQNSESYLFSRDPASKVYGDVKCYHWQEGVKRIFED